MAPEKRQYRPYVNRRLYGNFILHVSLARNWFELVMNLKREQQEILFLINISASK